MDLCFFKDVLIDDFELPVVRVKTPVIVNFSKEAMIHLACGTSGSD